MLSFHKYQGTGNDFIIVDDRAGTFAADTGRIARLCDRRFGIGADGLMLLQRHPQHDFRMVYFNADGRAGSLCGNGGRCLVRFAHSLGLFASRTVFEAADGLHEASVQPDGQVSLKMNDVDQVQRHARYDFLDTGSPHYVVFVPDAGGMEYREVMERGRAIRHDPAFAPGGTNVNFATLQPDASLYVRTYERGVEDETYSCGTGVTACALAASYHGAASPVRIATRGGGLQVSFRQTGPQAFTDIYLTGPAQKVFEGEIPA